MIKQDKDKSRIILFSILKFSSILKLFLLKVKNRINRFITDLKYKRFLLKIRHYKIDNIFTHLTNEEKLKLYELASKKTGIFVEIGSYLGASASIIALAISNNKSGELFCIDTWQNDAMSEGKKDTFKQFQRNTAKFSHIISPMLGASVEVSKTFNKKVNFLFIDGDHSYEAVKADVEAWFPKLNKNALVIFHDSGWAEGVQKVITEDVKPKVRKGGILPNMWWGWMR